MAKQQYRFTGQFIGPFSCVSINTYDHTLAGIGGQIWEYAPGAYRAVIYLPGGSERVISFGPDKLKHWVHKLQVPLNPHQQVFWANNPGAKSRLE